jgi:hypothetical protein
LFTLVSQQRDPKFVEEQKQLVREARAKSREAVARRVLQDVQQTQALLAAGPQRRRKFVRIVEDERAKRVSSLRQEQVPLVEKKGSWRFTGLVDTKENVITNPLTVFWFPFISIFNSKVKQIEPYCWSKAITIVPPDHLLLDSAPNIGPLISRWELDKFKNC